MVKPKTLSNEIILQTAEEVLRKYGPKKTTVVDIANELNVSHGTVYRYFKSKSELHAAITKRWLEKITAPLRDITASDDAPKARLRHWFEQLMYIKVNTAKSEPEMFSSYSMLAKKLPEHVILEHLDSLIQQVAEILQQGKKQKIFAVEDCNKTAHTLFFATIRYHHPLHVKEWDNENLKNDFDDLFDLLERALVNG